MKMLQISALMLGLISCAYQSDSKKNSDISSSLVIEPAVVFDGDSAYSYVAAQVEFGPRVPGSEAHKLCGDYLVAKLGTFSPDTIIVQDGTLKAYNGDKLPYRNILARYDSQSDKRVLLLAHWDSRPWADQEPNVDDRLKPVPGANDGASGAGVLLEIARQLQKKRPGVGVDLLLVDVEDYGRADGWGTNEETWCLGTQKWLASNPYPDGKLPSYGILLDMVGARDAKFYREFTSQRMAKQIVDKVWSNAVASGYGDRFVNEIGTAITDDHIFICRAGIPCVDIIECMNPVTKSFHPTWHTLKDDMDIIDPATLKAVGQVVANVVYNEVP